MRPWCELLNWFDLSARELPWRENRLPYPIWVSEIILQQTRVNVATDRFRRFMAAFPDIYALAEADIDTVLKEWEGLGYYSRARNMHKTARIIAYEYGGEFPQDLSAMRALPGIGEYMAAAILSQAFSLPYAAVDANVLKVLGRYLGLHYDLRDMRYRNAVRDLAGSWVESAGRPGDMNQALMELGGVLCEKQPKCAICPLKKGCAAYLKDETGMIPMRRPKAPRPESNLWVIVAIRGKEVLVRQRSEGLLNGLWEFITARKDQDVDGILSSFGLRSSKTVPMGDKKHVFTHLIWHLEGTLAFVEGDAPEGFSFVDEKALMALAFPSAFSPYREKALDYLRGKKSRI